MEIVSYSEEELAGKIDKWLDDRGITKDGIIDICSKSVLIKPIKKPNNAKVKDTNISKNIINNGY